MYIDKNVFRYIVQGDESIQYALQKITQNKKGVVCVADEYGSLDGIITDGDVRRWLVSQDTIDLDIPCSAIAQRNPVYAAVDSDPEAIESLFSDRVKAVPLLGLNKRLVAIAFAAEKKLLIGRREIAQDSKTFIIAEIGNNHQGSVEHAIRLIDAAVGAGADCVKMQLRNMSALYDLKRTDQDLGVEYTIDLLRKYNLSNEKMQEVWRYCASKQIAFMCTPWEMASLQVLIDWQIDGLKIASADLTNHELIQGAVNSKLPVVLSTGMSTEQEIQEAYRIVSRNGAAFGILHCNSTYPTPDRDVNLGYIARLRSMCPAGVVGYSGHERGHAIAVAAAALGAKIIEKHLTFDQSQEGADHKVSLLPDQFQAMCRDIRRVEEAMGVPEMRPRTLSQGEMINRENLSKSLVATKSIEIGEIIDRSMVTVKSPGKGLQPNRLSELIGKRANRRVDEGEFFYESDLEPPTIQSKNFSFRRPWGVPVRYHDAMQLSAEVSADLLEYHLSYRDLEKDPSAVLKGDLPPTVVVHAPELFSEDHVLDLCSSDETYLTRSIHEMRRVISVAKQLRKIHRQTDPVGIVTNVGGFSVHGPLSAYDRAMCYDRLKRSLAALADDEVRIWPQTMPPYPWHFGGQRYHNLFLEGPDIAEFCRASQLMVCLDVSHSRLACIEAGWSFDSFIREVGPVTAHLHIADARGVDGEGLQIGEGDMDFAALGRLLDEVAPSASFIPEVWQGHKDNGKGFWIALERLESSWAQSR